MTEQTNTHNEPSLDQLARDFAVAKEVENQAKKARIAAEEALLPFVEDSGEGSKTITTEAGAKIKVTRKMNRKLNFEGFNAIRDQIPENLRPIEIKEVLSDVGIKYLQANEPEIYALIAPHLTVTPAKPSLKVTIPVEVPEVA